MSTLIRMELKKAFSSVSFLGVLLISILVCLFGVVDNVFHYQEALKNAERVLTIWQSEGYIGDPQIYTLSSYTSWIGGESSSPAFAIFFYVFPLITTISYSWSAANEISTGYLKNISTRVRLCKYISAKYIATFVTGGIAVAFPLLMNFIFTAAFIPSIRIEPSQYYINNENIWSEVFYQFPLLYVLLYIILDFLGSGAIATAGMAVGIKTRSEISSIILPFIILLLIHFLRFFLYDLFSFVQLSPFYFLHATPIENPAKWWIVFPFVFVIAAGSFLFVYFWSKKNEYQLFKI